MVDRVDVEEPRRIGNVCHATNDKSVSALISRAETYTLVDIVGLVKPAFHDADANIDTDSDILARILADILARIVASMLVSASVSMSWNAAPTPTPTSSRGNRAYRT